VIANHTTKYHCQTVSKSNSTTKSGVTTNHLCRPDLTTFDNNLHDNNFHYASALWEVKVKPEHAPNPKCWSMVIGQMADAVRLRMGSRPFQLFTLSLILCDQQFWAAMWDCSGVVISKAHDLETDQDIFLQVIISLHCFMDLYDLGLDWKVIILAKLCYILLYPDCPSIQIGKNKWVLVGRIFQAITLLGQGTTVWHVWQEDDIGKIIECALKWSWILPTQTLELEIHQNIQANFQNEDLKQPCEIAHPNLNNAQNGGPSKGNLQDVVDVHLIQQNLENSIPVLNQILSQILLKRVGKPIWDYKTNLEIMYGACNLL
jgi:hypothetical protein